MDCPELRWEDYTFGMRLDILGQPKEKNVYTETLS
jgi:hypothetical protein